MATSFLRWTILLGFLFQAVLSLEGTSSGVPNSSDALPKVTSSLPKTSEVTTQSSAFSTDTSAVASSVSVTTSPQFKSTPSPTLKTEDTSHVTSPISSSVTSPSPDESVTSHVSSSVASISPEPNSPSFSGTQSPTLRTEDISQVTSHISSSASSDVPITSHTSTSTTRSKPETESDATGTKSKLTNNKPEVKQNFAEEETHGYDIDHPNATTLSSVTTSATREANETLKFNSHIKVESTILILSAQVTNSVPELVSSTTESKYASANDSAVDESSGSNGTKVIPESGVHHFTPTTETPTQLPTVTEDSSEVNRTVGAGQNASSDASGVVIEIITNTTVDVKDAPSNTVDKANISTVTLAPDGVSFVPTSTRKQILIESTVLDSTTSSTVPSLEKDNKPNITETVNFTREPTSVNVSLAYDINVNQNVSLSNETDDIIIYTETNVSDKVVSTTNNSISSEEGKTESNVDPFVVIVDSVNSDLISLNDTINKDANITVDIVTTVNKSDATSVTKISNNTPGHKVRPPNLTTSNYTETSIEASQSNTTSNNLPDTNSSTIVSADNLRPKTATHKPPQEQVTENSTAKDVSEETIKSQQMPLESVVNRPSSAANVSTEETRKDSVPESSSSSVFVTDGSSPSIVTSTVASSTEYMNVSDMATAAEETEYRVTGIIKIIEGATWNSRLTDLRSSDFRLLAATLKDQLNTLYQADDVGQNLKEIEINSFSDNEGSILVMFSLVFTSKVDWLDSKKLKHVVIRGLKNGYLGSFKLDADYTNFGTPWSNPHNPLEMGNSDPPIPQWAIAVIVVAAACLIFSLLFAAVTVYGRGQGSPHSSLYDSEGMLDSPCPEWERKMAAAYENMAADNVSETDMPKRRSFRDEPLRQPLERSSSIRSNSSVRRNPESAYALNS